MKLFPAEVSERQHSAPHEFEDELATAVFLLKSTYVVFVLQKNYFATGFLRILIFPKAPLGETFGFSEK